MDQGICGFPSRLSHKSFPRGFPTGLSHVPPWCESILGLKVQAVQGKQVSLEWTETSGVSGNVGTTLEFLSPFLWRAPPLEVRRERGTSFTTTQGKDSSSRPLRRKRGSCACGRDSRASSRVGAYTCAFLPSCSSSVTLPYAWIKGSVAFPQGFPSRHLHESFPQGCPTCHRGASRSSA